MKTVFITGAAAGIGLAIAKRFTAEGWLVGLYDINEEAIKQLLQTSEFSHACGGHCDVTNRDSVSRALQSFAERSEGRMVENIPEQLMETFTVDLVPEQIADVVMSALKGSGQSYIVSMKAKVWAALIKLLPGRLGRGLTKSLTGY